MILLIVLGLLVLGSFVACYFSSKYWHWSQVLVVELVFLFGLSYYLLAAEVFRIQNIYGQAYEQNEQQLTQLQPRVRALQSGTGDQQVIGQLEASEVPVRMEDRDEDESPRMRGLRDLKHELGLVTQPRGRVWRDVEPLNLEGDSLTATLGIPAPDPHGLEEDALLYVFEQGPAGPPGEGAQYLGEFRVVSTAPQQIQVQPASTFDQRSVERLQQTRGPWILYDSMPVDQHPDGQLQLLTDATPEELQQMLPAESVDEYIRHGSEARVDDDQWHREGLDPAGESYRRQLRDYGLIFQELAKRYTQMRADVNALTEDNKQLEDALASARELQSLREQEQAKLQHDLEGATRDREAIEAHQAQVESQLANARALLEEVTEENARLAEALGSG